MTRRPDGELASRAKQGANRSQAKIDHPVAQLQRSMGNRALAGMIGGRVSALPAGVQAKLTVGPAGDVYEQEADQVGKLVADTISSMPSGGQPVQRMDGSEEEELQMKRAPESIQRMDGPEEEELQMKRAPESIQRMGGPEEEEELQLKRAPEGIQRMDGPEEEELQMKRAPESIQRMDAPEEEELQMKRAPESVQRSALEDGFEADESLERQIESSRGGGSPMDTHVQAKMESAFGTGFAGVNIHTDANADRLARSIGAEAFTTGSDIFFRQGRYNPDTREGQELLGHELTHVVQQTGGSLPTDERKK
jgi:hypothetical protein